MKSFNDYLCEFQHNYNYRVKVAGECSKEHLEHIKHCLGKFDLVSMSDPKTTPVQPNPLDFPELKNSEVTIFDIEIKYPASTEQVADIFREVGVDPDRVLVIDKNYDESRAAEEALIRQEESPVLEKENYPEPSKDQKDLSKKYSESFKDIVKNAANTKFEIAGKAEKPAKTTNDVEGNNKSPMSNIKRKSVGDMLK